MRIFFDVYGTLLSEVGERLRPGAAELLQRLSEDGHKITLWSSAGAGFAHHFALRFNLLPWIEETLGKTHLSSPPDFCVDDVSEFLVGSKGNARVSSYRGDDEDRELDAVSEAIQQAVVVEIQATSGRE